MKPGKVRPIALCVFRNDGRILVQEGFDRVKEQAFYRPLGGTIEFGELSQDTVVRELREELSVEVTQVRYLGTLENIFVLKGQMGHEIIMVYDGVLTDPSLYHLTEITGYEDDSHPLKARWITLSDYHPQVVSTRPPLYPTGLYKLLEEHP
jgi:ADP-ribose pyrophosphatase YjhB (NUDIX family)